MPAECIRGVKCHLFAYLLDFWIRDRLEAEILANASCVLSETEVNGFPGETGSKL